MAGTPMTLSSIRSQIASAVTLVVQVQRLPDGARRVTSVSEIVGMDGDAIQMNEIFQIHEGIHRQQRKDPRRFQGNRNTSGISRRSQSLRHRDPGEPLRFDRRSLSDARECATHHLLSGYSGGRLRGREFAPARRRAAKHERSIKRRLALSVSADANSQLHDALRQERGLADLDNSRLSGLNDLLIQTGLKPTKLGLAVWTLLIGVAIAASMLGIVSRPGLAAVAALIAPPSLVIMYLAIARQRRIARFTEQLPDALDIIVRSLRIGHPLAAAIRLVAGEMPDPAGGELRLTADEIAFGQDTVTAVSNLHRRVGQDDLTFLVIAVSVQSQTGGNLADLLAQLTTLMRARAALQLKIKAISAEGRLSAWFLSAMPFVLFGGIRLLSRSYFDDFLGSEALVPILIYGCASLIISNVIIYRMVNFRI